VQELVLHRDPALLDEVVPLLISEFQVSRGTGGGREGGLGGGEMRRQKAFRWVIWKYIPSHFVPSYSSQAGDSPHPSFPSLPPSLPQADPLPSIRKFLVEFLEEVVKAHPSFCQPGMVDVYGFALIQEESPAVLKRVLIAATNVHRSVLR